MVLIYHNVLLIFVYKIILYNVVTVIDIHLKEKILFYLFIIV